MIGIGISPISFSQVPAGSYTPPPPTTPDDFEVVTPPSIFSDLRIGHAFWIDTAPEFSEAPMYLDFQWLADDEEIVGATQAAFVADDPQLGAMIKLRITAHHDGGELEVETNEMGPITSRAPGPLYLTPPSITGDPIVGQEITIDLGTWDDNGAAVDPDETIEWDADGILIDGLDDMTTITVTEEMIGKRIVAIVTITNANGHTSAVSNQTEPVA